MTYLTFISLHDTPVINSRVVKDSTLYYYTMNRTSTSIPVSPRSSASRGYIAVSYTSPQRLLRSQRLTTRLSTVELLLVKFRYLRAFEGGQGTFIIALL